MTARRCAAPIASPRCGAGRRATRSAKRSPDASTAAAALNSGEVDWWENPTLDLARSFAGNPDVTVVDTDPLGSMGLLRFNQLLPPFDNVKMRQAVLAVTDQTEFMTALAGDP